MCRALEQVGPEALTIAGICAQAKVAHGTFYIYFANRNAAIDDVLLRFSAFVQARMRAASQLQPESPTRAATATYMGLFEQNIGLMRCFLRHLDTFPAARTAFQELNRAWLELVVASAERRLRRAGRAVAHDELMRRAYALGGMVDQYLAGLLLDHDPHMAAFSRDREALADTFNLLWERGMEP